MKNKPPFTDAQWVAFCADVRKIFDDHWDEIANPNGVVGTNPYIGRNEISFNGIEDDAHETCVVRRGGVKFEFCKTARKPYDKVVVKVYKLVRKYLPETVLSSDGGEAVFGNVVVVEAPNGKRLTYSAGGFEVKVGDRVVLPPLSFDKDGDEWVATVIATESDYEGRLVEIIDIDELALTVEEAQKPTVGTLKDAIERIILDDTDATLNVDFAAEKIVKLVQSRLK